MTDKSKNNDNGASDGSADRVIGTPSPAEGTAIVAGSDDPGAEHPGAYPPEETHAHSEEQQRRAEKTASMWFLIAFLAGIGFFVAYFAFPPNGEGEPAIADPQIGQYSNMALGGTLALALFGIGAGMTVWARWIMPHYEVSTPYDDLSSSSEEKGSFGDFFMRSADESGFTKRPLLRRTLLLSMVPLGLAPIVLLRDTGPLPGDKLKHTLWEDGLRMVVEGTNKPIKEADLAEDGAMITAFPLVEGEGGEHGGEAQHLSLNDQAKTVVLLIKIPEGDFKPGMTEQQMNWTHNGIVAYSKICTHVGCPAALYERGSHRILCPCHQSTFDAADGAKVVFGPAHRPLPQLPIGVDDEGYLIAKGDFSEAVGPTFWDAEKGD
ncbi:Rieske 2Fe-2S domain-containing protein [Nocardiopsis sp. RSe5-2]|uniref:Cytochrome bc1 complex Rieske iron-sulfur subunit n=1 Tax=Nocardiopsis endophytica TaxID=3018445 RepID=A0ABT4UB19_9ACTN|nr:Rieske 2Fe-2S domain-containing protein [Nocardiopsis endophytica]MDA2814166.1 Rieske 2Fe-2S domain-containing protein [Nocardiopsis endophytica]